MKKYQQDFEQNSVAEEINISPLIDVIFILLIFFLVSMVFVDKRSLEVDVPSAENATENPSNFSTITIANDGSIFFNSKRTTISALPSQIKASGIFDILLCVDKSVRAEALVKVIDTAKASGAKSIHLATSKK